MKRSELFFSFLLVPLDYAMIVLAGLAAYYLRFSDFFKDLRPVVFELPFDSYVKALLPLALLWLLVFFPGRPLQHPQRPQIVQRIISSRLGLLHRLYVGGGYDFYQPRTV
jgi:hypothetical protein